MGPVSLAPSAAHVWGPGACPASARMSAEIPRPDVTTAQLEGRAAHWVVEEALRGRDHAEGDPTPHQVTVSQAMIDGARQAVQDARRVIGNGARWCVEASVNLSRLSPTAKGRLDFGAFIDTNGVLYAWDYKFGHRGVDAFENWQVVAYAMGLLDYFQLQPHQVLMYDLRIYQPRAFSGEGPVRRWVVSAQDFAGYAARLVEAARQALDPHAPCKTGDHCAGCDARFSCPALRSVAAHAVDLSEPATPAPLSASEAGRALREIKAAEARLKAMATGLEAQVSAAVRAGDPSTGFEFVPGRGSTVWKTTPAEVVALGQIMGVDLAKPLDVITPKQAIEKGIDGAVIKAYSESRPGEMKLTPTSTAAVKKAFS